jgi:hypothetical protein
MIQGARIAGSNVKFFRDGDAFSDPVAGVCSRNDVPGDDDAGWQNVGPILDSGVENETEEKEVWGPKNEGGKILLHDIVTGKRGLTRTFTTQELSAFVIEHLYGTAALDELSEDFFALSGSVKKGWLLINRYDQDDVLLVTEKAYVHLTITGPVKMDANIVLATFSAKQLFSAHGYPLLTQAGFQILTQEGQPILIQ